MPGEDSLRMSSRWTVAPVRSQAAISCGGTARGSSLIVASSRCVLPLAIAQAQTFSPSWRAARDLQPELPDTTEDLVCREMRIQRLANARSRAGSERTACLLGFV